MAIETQSLLGVGRGLTVALGKTTETRVREIVREELKPSAVRRVFDNLRYWGLLAAIVSVILALLGMVITLGVFATNKLTQEADFRARTDERLKQLDESSRKLEEKVQKLEVSLSAFATKISLQNISALDKTQFAKALPELTKLKLPPTPQSRPSQEVLQTIATKLHETDPKSPDYWPAVLKFLEYATNSSQPQSRPAAGQAEFHTGQHTFDSLKVLNSHVYLDGGRLIDTVFENSLITFTNEPVAMTNVRFINCRFEFPASTSPDPYIKRAAQLLLTTSLDSVLVNKFS